MKDPPEIHAYAGNKSNCKQARPCSESGKNIKKKIKLKQFLYKTVV